MTLCNEYVYLIMIKVILKTISKQVDHPVQKGTKEEKRGRKKSIKVKLTK